MRLIDADAFEKFIRKNCTDSLVDLWCELVRRQPTIEAIPVVHGCNNNQNYHGVDEFRCSVCGLHLEDWERHVHDGGAEFIREYEFKYCPECGVKIKGGE